MGNTKLFVAHAINTGLYFTFLSTNSTNGAQQALLLLMSLIQLLYRIFTLQLCT